MPWNWEALGRPLRLVVLASYLLSWLAFLGGAVWTILPRSRQRHVVRAPQTLNLPVLAGTLLQVLSALAITLRMPEEPLSPKAWELAGAAVLAPVSALVFCWALMQAAGARSDKLVTEGPYSLVRHPIYLSFLAMLGATGLLASEPVRLLIAAAMYVAGTELRVAVEESELAGRFGQAYRDYCQRTRWRYLPGVR